MGPGGAALCVGVLLGAGPVAAAGSTTTTTTPAPPISTTTTSTTTTSTTTTPAAAPTATPTDSWLRRATAAESTLGSVHINGSIDQGKTHITLSLLVNGNGDGDGSFTQQGSRIQLKRVGPLLFFNAPTKYWNQHATKAETKRYCGKWIEVSALDARYEDFRQFLDAGELTASVFQGYTRPLTVSRPTKLDGHKVVIVSDSAAADGRTNSVKMYIDDTGKPYVVQIVDRTTTQATTLTFTAYGKSVSITTPPEPINLT